MGTLAPTILFGGCENAPFIRVLGLLCSIFDLAYIGRLLWAKRQPVPLKRASALNLGRDPAHNPEKNTGKCSAPRHNLAQPISQIPKSRSFAAFTRQWHHSKLYRLIAAGTEVDDNSGL